MHRQPFKSVGEGHHPSRKLQLVHSDVCGRMDESIGGKRYFVSFIDDYSRCCAVCFMNTKSGVLEKFQEFEAITTNESGQCIRTLGLTTVASTYLRCLKLTCRLKGSNINSPSHTLQSRTELLSV